MGEDEVLPLLLLLGGESVAIFSGHLSDEMVSADYAALSPFSLRSDRYDNSVSPE